MEWVTFRLTGPLKSGDVVGCGWVREDEGTKGAVYFTLNGERTENGFTEVPPELIPFIHIQKKASHIKKFVDGQYLQWSIIIFYY